jgi:hypothetical protein
MNSNSSPTNSENFKRRSPNSKNSLQFKKKNKWSNRKNIFQKTFYTETKNALDLQHHSYLIIFFTKSKKKKKEEEEKKRKRSFNLKKDTRDLIRVKPKHSNPQTLV